MKTSNEESSTSSRLFTQLPTFKGWVQVLQTYSNKYKKYGSFLPSQEELLKRVYAGIFLSKSRVAAFTAPPASGKTHVIALCAAYLHDRNASTCIVTPNNELRYEFRDELTEVDCESTKILPIMNIGAFVKRRNQFDYAFIDEAHNLRSAIELDPHIVISIHLEKGGPLYDVVISTLEKDGSYIAKELSVETAHGILQKMKRRGEYERRARQILNALSQWRGFCIVSDATCDLKFLAADPDRRCLLPRGRLFLFSATLLDQEELHFYCNIPAGIIQRYDAERNGFAPKKNVIYRYIQCVTDQGKKDFVVALLKSLNLPTLILNNSNATCLRWSNFLSKKLGNRVIVIQSGLHYKERLDMYRRFTTHSRPILVTSSSAYWEGISIKNLKLLIIPNPPFPQPSLLEIAQGRHTQYNRIAKRRLIQGMGRVGRNPTENGVCFLLFRPQGLTSSIKAVTEEKAKSLVANLAE